MNKIKTGRIVAVAIAFTMIAAAAMAAAAVTGMSAKATRGFPSVVTLSGSGVDVPVLGEAVLMEQTNKTFMPGVLVARVGQAVTFRNNEDMLHNVHGFNMDSGDTVFNVAQPIFGMQMDFIFEEAGTYAILCDVHPEMEAYVVVTDAPYATVAEADGAFTLEAPAGDYELQVWNVQERKQRIEKVTIGSDGLTVQ